RREPHATLAGCRVVRKADLGPKREHGVTEYVVAPAQAEHQTELRVELEPRLAPEHRCWMGHGPRGEPDHRANEPRSDWIEFAAMKLRHWHSVEADTALGAHDQTPRGPLQLDPGDRGIDLHRVR